MAIELDYIEYSTDANAQTAYVSSDEFGADVSPVMTSADAPAPNVVSESSKYAG